MASTSHALYTGVTNNLLRRVHQHKGSSGSRFAHRYRINRLVHYEETHDIRAAIAREKEIKSWRRAKKVALVEADNPRWEDLATDWYAEDDSTGRSG